MTYENDIEQKTVEKSENGRFEIVRSVTISRDYITGKIVGRQKVYYDLIDIEEDYTIGSYKTLAEAKRVLKKWSL